MQIVKRGNHVRLLRTIILDIIVLLYLIICAYLRGILMRTTVTIEKGMIDELLDETKAKNKASAVREAVSDYLRRKKIHRIRSLKGKLEFDSDTAARRHHER